MHPLSALNKEFVARGFHHKPVRVALSHLALHVSCALGGAAAFMLAHGLPAKAAALVVMTLGNLGISGHTHTSSHNGTSPRLWVNRALTFFGYGIMFGTSSTWWWNKHIAVHHTTPNVIGLDDDVDLLPWFALTEEAFNSGGPLRRWYYRHQWMLLPLALALTALNMTRASNVYLLAALRDPRRRRPLLWIDLGAVVAHYVLWIGLPMLWFHPAHVVGFYLLRGALLGFAVFSTAAPAHFPAESCFLPAEGHVDRGEYRRHSDYILLQTVTTVNYRTSGLGRVLCCGIEFQIEHHLFPGFSYVQYPRMSPIIREFCAAHGYPYRTLSWWEGVRKSLRVFKHPKPVAPALEAVQLRAMAEALHA